MIRNITKIVLLTILVASGCSAESGTAPAQDEQDFDEAFTDVDDSGLGVGDFVSFDASSHGFVQDALFELTRRCMKEAGFEYTPPIFQEDRFTFGFRSPEQLRSGGYAITKEDWSDEPGENQKTLDGLSPDDRLEWAKALRGDRENSINIAMPNGDTVSSSQDGCYAEATIDVFGSVGDTIVYEQVRDNLGGLAIRSAIIADERHIETAEDWVECLAEKGQTVTTDTDSLMEIAVNFYHESSPEQASQDELRLAKDDADCLEETGLSTLREDLVDEYQTQKVESASYDMAGAAAFQQRALERAQELVGGQP